VKTNSRVNTNGDNYVAYLFAHNDGDGEFGPDGDADIIKCGSYTGNGSSTGPEIDLGFEPQWVMIKAATNYTSGNWLILDTMRGWTANSGNQDGLYANLSDAEIKANSGLSPTSTGFQIRDTTPQINGSGNEYIYIAIRRGPMAVPESATEVFAIDTKNSTGDNKTPLYRSGFPVDLALLLDTDGGSDFPQVHPRLASTKYLRTNNTAAEQSGSAFTHDFMNGFRTDTSFSADTTRVCHMWKRAPNYFDVVTYTGNGVQGRNITHNLGVAPDMMWVKNRNRTSGSDWMVYVSGITHLSTYGSDPDNRGDNPASLFLNKTDEANFSMSGNWDHTHPTDTTFRVGDTYHTNENTKNIIAYLFASLPGISKVGSYTGNGSSQTINCGFTTGARFILIKRTDSTGDWWFFDTERGLGKNLRLNTTDAESSNTGMYANSSGFLVLENNPMYLNTSGASYIFYAIA